MYAIPYGKDRLEFEAPSGARVDVVTSKDIPPLADVKAAVAAALREPVASPRLREIAKPGNSVCIVFTDITRSSPDHIMVPALLAELEAAGVRDEDITLLCGIGMHRDSTPEEKIVKLGREVVDRYRVVDHEPQNPAALVDLGTSESGIPLSVNKIAFESDLLIATGIVEPHQYAGYSGGRKTLAVGAAGEKMIAYTHGPAMIDHPGVRLGQTENNPFHEAITEAAKRAGLRFIINVVQDDDKRPVAVYAGAPEAAFEKLIAVARDLYVAPIERQYDIAVAGVGFPKDANIYQASRAASYLFFAPTSVVRDGGVIIIPAPTEEGAGHGVGEQRFLEVMRNAGAMGTLLDDMRRDGYPPGVQRAFIMAKVLEKNEVIIVGSETPDLVRDSKMIPAATMDEAFALACKTLGKQNPDIIIVPHALLTLPIVQS